MKYRLIDTIFEGTKGLLSLGIDEALLASVASKEVLPTIRLSRLTDCGVSVGYHQKIEDEVNVKLCNELGIPIARRLTTGGAVMQENEIVYSVIVPIGSYLAPPDVDLSYELICNGIIAGLSLLGINAGFKPLNDVVVNGRKISGSAQTRRSGVLLQQGTILVDVDVDKMFSVLKVNKEKLHGRSLDEVKGNMTWVRRELGFDVPYTFIDEALKTGFSRAWDAEFENDEMNDAEMKDAEDIIEMYFGNVDWNYRLEGD